MVILTSCSKSKCSDMNSLSFDSSPNCRYTKAIFYAPSNMIGGSGIRVVKIEVFRRVIETEELIGTITNLKEKNPVPVGCTAPVNGIEYNFTQKDKAIFTTRYYYEDGTDESGNTYIIETSNSVECVVKELTLFIG